MRTTSLFLASVLLVAPSVALHLRGLEQQQSQNASVVEQQQQQQQEQQQRGNATRTPTNETAPGMNTTAVVNATEANSTKHSKWGGLWAILSLLSFLCMWVSVFNPPPLPHFSPVPFLLFSSLSLVLYFYLSLSVYLFFSPFVFSITRPLLSSPSHPLSLLPPSLPLCLSSSLSVSFHTLFFSIRFQSLDTVNSAVPSLPYWLSPSLPPSLSPSLLQL